MVFDTIGPPSVLKLVQLPIPKRKDGEVLVKNYAAGVLLRPDMGRDSVLFCQRRYIASFEAPICRLCLTI